MKTKKMNNKKLNLIIATAVIVLVLATGLIAFLVSNKLESESPNEALTLDDFYSSYQCRCLERNTHSCLEGFEYNKTRELCVNSLEKKVTLSILKCSSYECLGQVYNFNSDINGWEAKK